MAKVSKRLRYEILRRDGFRCRYCGARPAERELRVDHVVPIALGGSNEPSNLATACEPCNSGKTSTTPDAPIVDDVAASALQWTSAMQAAATAMEEEIRSRRSRNDWFLIVWRGYSIGDVEVPLPDDWSDGVTRLEAAGLTYLLFEEAVAAAMKAFNVKPENRFRYFCGVAWNMVTQLQEAAREAASGGHPGAAAGQWASMDRADLEGALWCFEQVTEQLLLKVPSWLQECAERGCREDVEKAGEAELDRIELLPHVLRHLGDQLANCTIEPNNKDN